MRGHLREEPDGKKKRRTGNSGLEGGSYQSHHIAAGSCSRSTGEAGALAPARGYAGGGVSPLALVTSQL
jgi:hypothetical protein